MNRDKNKILIIHPYLTENILEIFKEIANQAPNIFFIGVIPKNFQENSIYNRFSNNFQFSFPKNIKLKRIKFIPRGRKNPVLNPLSLFLILIKIKPKAIIVLDEAISLNTFFSAVFGYFFKSKVFFYGFENINTYKKRSFFVKMIIFIIKKLVNYGFVCTKEARQILNEMNWYPKTKIVWWGISMIFFRRRMNNSEKEKLKKKLGINFNSKIIGFIGRFVEEKGIRDLISAVKLINRDLTLLFVGDGPLQKFLKEQSINTNKKIIIISPLDSKSLSKYYQIIDVLVLPSRTTQKWKEQYGRVLVEAMAAGVSLVGSSSGAIPEIIDDVGTVFPEGNIPLLANAIEWEIQNRSFERISKLKERAKLGSVKNFAKEILQFVQENI